MMGHIYLQHKWQKKGLDYINRLAIARIFCTTLVCIYACVIPETFAETRYESERGVVVRTADNSPPLIKFVAPKPAPIAESNPNRTVKARVHIRPNGYVGDLQAIRIDSDNMRLWLRVEEALRQWQYQPALANGSPVAAVTEVEIEFPRTAVHNSGNVLLDTDTYYVTETADASGDWCLPQHDKASVNVIFRAPADKDLSATPEYRRRFESEIWPVIERACNPITAVFASNYLVGVRVLANASTDIPETELLKHSQRERPINVIMVQKNTAGTLEYRMMADFGTYASLAELRAARGQQASAILPVAAPRQAAPLSAEDAFPPLQLQGLPHGRQIKTVYLGQFSRMPIADLNKLAVITDDGIIGHKLLGAYVEAFSDRCHDSLSSNKIAIKETITRRSQRINGLGMVVSEENLGSVTNDTGIFAEPEFAKAYVAVRNSESFEALVVIMRQLMAKRASSFGGAGFSVLSEVIEIGAEMREIIARHGCNSSQIKRLGENILSYVTMQSPKPEYSFDAFAHYCRRTITAIIPQTHPSSCPCIQKVLQGSLSPKQYWDLEDDFTEQRFLTTSISKVGLRQKLATCF